ncbi:MAG: hypothetical protein K8S16_21235 [Bacteroidales bacterium]|nr:hypothetical protein [Bacteroidales bacterium]
MDNNNKSEDLLYKILQKSPVKKPSDDFTSRVMHTVYNIQADGKPARVLFKKFLNIGLVFIASATVLTATFYYLTKSGISILPEKSGPAIFPVFKTIISYFNQIFESISISPITWVIILGVFIIFLLDRVIKKLQLLKNLNLSF